MYIEIRIFLYQIIPLDTGLAGLLDAVCTFNLRPLSMGFVCIRFVFDLFLLVSQLLSRYSKE